MNRAFAPVRRHLSHPPCWAGTTIRVGFESGFATKPACVCMRAFCVRSPRRARRVESGGGGWIVADA